MPNANFRHGFGTKDRTYNSWVGMRQRCNNPKQPRFKDYGELDIEVCERWDEFENFLVDMGICPDNNHVIDRIDNNKGYSKENCRWVTYAQSSYNKGIYRNNTSGHKGVSWSKQAEGWFAYINRNRKRIPLGIYENIEDAVAARKAAEKKYES